MKNRLIIYHFKINKKYQSKGKFKVRFMVSMISTK